MNSETVPNSYLSFITFLALCISIASYERSFTKLKLTENYLHSTISQVRLEGLTIISITGAIAKNINFEETITKNVLSECSRKTVFGLLLLAEKV